MLSGLFGLIVLLLDIYAIYQIWISTAATVHKVLWTLLILVLPLVGFIIWIFAGPRGAGSSI